MATSSPKTRGVRRCEAELDLGEAINALEAVRWGDVPGVSAVTAATFCQQLQWSRAALQGDGDGQVPNVEPVDGGR